MQQFLLTIAFILSSMFVAHSQESKSNSIGTITTFENSEINEAIPSPLFVLFEENYSEIKEKSEQLTLEIKF